MESSKGGGADALAVDAATSNLESAAASSVSRARSHFPPPNFKQQPSHYSTHQNVRFINALRGARYPWKHGSRWEKSSDETRNPVPRGTGKS